MSIVGNVDRSRVRNDARGEPDMPIKTAFVAPLSAPKPGFYSDGCPLDDVRYLECKLILKPEGFTSAESCEDYAALVRRAGAKLGVGLFTGAVAGRTPDRRDVVFFDTPDFRLYNNAFILRGRTRYDRGFPQVDPEIVLKFRHPDLQKAAEMDVRPNISGAYRIKFKTEALPLRDRIGGYRTLFSHNTVIGHSQAQFGDSTSMAVVTRIFPVLQAVVGSPDDRVEFVNQAVIEEMLQQLGTLDFGKGVTGACNVALWRSRAEGSPLVAEFAFQCKFKRSDQLHQKAMQRCRDFFVELQRIGSDRVWLGTTKTAVVYRLDGAAPQNAE
jgi:hypothetical protein